MARRPRPTNLPAPYLKEIRLRDDVFPLPAHYPFDLPWLDADFAMSFDTPVTILMGENGAGKSTLIEAIAALTGFSVAGGGAWSNPSLDHSKEHDPRALAAKLRGAWLPKIGRGWFLRAGSFEMIAEMMASDHLSVSHGEGFLGLIGERMQEQGLYILDEPEAALSPRRQVELLAFLTEIQTSASAQVVMATHSPMLMAVPGAALWRITHRSISQVNYRDTDHFRLWQSFTVDPEEFVSRALAGDIESLV